MGDQTFKPSVYLETTIISYLTARQVTDLVLAAKMKVTKDWWNDCQEKYDVFVSDAVKLEAAKGDPEAARLRMELMAGLSTLSITREVHDLAVVFQQGIPLPLKAKVDALHLAAATLHGVDFLLTWNCRHLANAAIRRQIESLIIQAGFAIPIICTPLELVEA